MTRLFYALKSSKKHDQSGLKEHTQHGFLSFRAKNARPGLESFFDVFIREDGGYTTLTTAISLLLCLTLTFSLASGTWVQNRSADIQSVADSAALSGANVVGSYMTLVSVVDACVLTMGLVGVAALGAGLVLSAIPGLSGVGATTIQAGTQVLESRQHFATSARKGLQKVELSLPLIMVARSSATVANNCSESVHYIGCAIPVPAASKSDFTNLDSELESDKVIAEAKDIQEASDAVKALKDVADAAKKRGWLADCGSDASSMFERAHTLAHLSGSDNKTYSLSSWTFGAALVRARAYYAKRLSLETPLSNSIEEITNSEVRKVFFAYAKEELANASYKESGDGTVEIDFPEFFSNTSEMKQTRLYTQARWPCTIASSKRMLHSSLQCPTALREASSGVASLAQLDAGEVASCPTCKMSAADMGKVAAASTNIDNGFEHYWQEVVEASREYEQAANELAEAQDNLKQASESGAQAFDELLSALTLPRPIICPPGAYGCVAAVWRADDITAPSQLMTSFVQTAHVGAGAAISAAVVAPDSTSNENTVLVRFMDAIEHDIGSVEIGVLGSFGRLWSNMLEAYASAYGGISKAASSVLEKIESIPGSSVAEGFCARLADMLKRGGFEPADMRLRKPVLTNSQNVLSKTGATGIADARRVVELLGQSKDIQTFANLLGQELSNKLDGKTFTLAELPIPTTNTSIPITVDVGEVLGMVTS